MKSTGVIRQLDSLGRIVLPIELRRTLNIKVKDEMEIYVESDRIVLRKHTASCVFCGGSEDTITYKDLIVCRKCLREMTNAERAGKA